MLFALYCCFTVFRLFVYSIIKGFLFSALLTYMFYFITKNKFIIEYTLPLNIVIFILMNDIISLLFSEVIYYNYIYQLY